MGFQHPGSLVVERTWLIFSSLLNSNAFPCPRLTRSSQVIQQLLRHGADLHTLDRDASKPLDFRRYFEEREDEIMQAVQHTLEYRRVTNVYAIFTGCGWLQYLDKSGFAITREFCST